MKTKTGLLLLAGVLAITAVPSISSSIATPARQQFQLTAGQKEFIRQFDEAVGTKVLPLASTPVAAPFIKVASIACGDNELQRDAVFALGATEWQAQDATKRFQTLFCDN
ncbi:hypothetical protein [Prochlorococcus marinus]|uniref:hypothetical protein n=1 Tax=Prochlorococcus TaxID=1218 RepID=UPI0007B3C637|nr:hypothetical protein [Prochlorococcus marinus]KZR78702.1 hypothetical protein PMIT1323_00036 [Prochlorococcus marinus str. MIT 1323]